MTTENENSVQGGKETAGSAGNVGAILLEEREKKGLTLEDMSLRTNVPKHYLAALENEEFDKIPGDVFVRGIIQRYGSFLGMDGFKLVARYRAAREGEDSVQRHAVPVRESKNVRIRPSFKVDRDAGAGLGTDHSHRALWIIAAVIVLVLAALAAYHFFGGPSKQAAPAAPAKSLTQTLGSFLPGSGNKSGEQDKTAAPAQPDQAKAAAAAIPGRVKLEIRAARGDCWLRVSEAGGKELYQGTLREGEARAFEAARDLTVRMGRPSSLEIVYNGAAQAKIDSEVPVERIYKPAGAQRQNP